MVDLMPSTFVTREAALKVAGRGRRHVFCEDQFVVTGRAILLFATLGPEGTALTAPDSLEWRPARTDYHPDEKIAWLPQAVIPEVRHRWKRLNTQAFVFLRKAGAEDRWLFCGPAQLGSYQHSHSGDGDHATYYFKRMPRAVWLEMGGHSGWQIRANGALSALEATDAAQFAALLKGLDPGMGHVSLTRWEGDEFSVYFNDTRAFPMYLKHPGDAGLYVEDSKASDHMEHFACPCCGIDLEFEGQSTIERREAPDYLARFFRSGTPPSLGESWSDGFEWVGPA